MTVACGKGCGTEILNDFKIRHAPTSPSIWEAVVSIGRCKGSSKRGYFRADKVCKGICDSDTCGRVCNPQPNPSWNLEQALPFCGLCLGAMQPFSIRGHRTDYPNQLAVCPSYAAGDAEALKLQRTKKSTVSDGRRPQPCSSLPRQQHLCSRLCFSNVLVPTT